MYRMKVGIGWEKKSKGREGWVHGRLEVVGALKWMLHDVCEVGG